MENKIKEVQEYLHERGIDVAETTIVNAAIDLATRWGGNAVFVMELSMQERRK